MVFIFGPELPLVLRRQFNFKSEDKKDPSNYISYQSIRTKVDDYNKDKIPNDFLYLSEICKDFLMTSDLNAIQRQWEDDSRPEHIKDEIKKREYRIEDRKYHNMTKDVTRTNNRSLLLGTDSVKDYEKSMNFAISFIFSIFASALVGYYLGIYFFKFPHDKSLVVAVFFLIGALILETTLYIIKITKDEQIERLRKHYETEKKTKVSNESFKKSKKD